MKKEENEMKKLRNLIAMTLVVAMAVTAMAGCGSSKKTVKASGQIVVGSTTDPTGDMVPYWSNGGTDYAAYNLTSGYGTVSLTKDSEYVYNDTAIKDVKATENEDGSKTWTYTLKDNLEWSNGEKITAKDYVFSILFWSSPEVATDLGAVDATYGYYFDGFDAFYNGETEVFKGVRLLSDTEFSITVGAENLPYYFEMALVSVGPTYMKGWVPEDVDIVDSENGCSFTANFTAEHIGETVEKYRYNPTAFSGPYVLESYDSSNLTYTLKANEKFLGDYTGQTAQIETIILKKVEQETMMDELKTGSVDLLPEITDGDQVVAGLEMVDNGDFDAVTYARNGYGHITFVCDNGPTQFTEVRQAVAYLLDRNEFARTFTKGYGAVVNGAYGLAMYEYTYNKDALEQLNSYSYSLDKAVEVLEAGGWTLDANGNQYNGTGVRYKNVDGKLMPLVLHWASSENNSVSDLIATMLAQNPDVAKAGMQIEQTVMTFAEMYTEHYQNQKEDYYNMYNLATNYTSVFDVQATYEVGSTANQNHIADEKLASLAKEMLAVDSKDTETYMAKWLEFEQRYNELLPSLPLYSNTYADLFGTHLTGYEGVSALWDWTSQILYAKVSSK